MDQVVINGLKDSTYCPYCMRCPRLARMRKIAHLYWRCECGADCDYRPLRTDMSNALYFPDLYSRVTIQHLLEHIPWVNVTDARRECFMALPPEDHVVDCRDRGNWPPHNDCDCFSKPMEYTYGSGRGVRTYTSVPLVGVVREVMDDLNSTTKLADGSAYCSYNVCFLNRYDDQGQHLGWHADDSPGMSHKHPIAVVSFGEEREIWTRKNGDTGVIPENQRQKLGHGSLFVMPEGFQLTNQHRIPKGDRSMKPRVSMTFRRYVPNA